MHDWGDQTLFWGWFHENNSAVYSDLCAVCPNRPNQVLVLLQVDALSPEVS